MFDFAWSEFALIGVVALIAIGPKDMPVAIKTVAQLIKKARRMAGEFQTHVDEMVREANLHDVRDQFNDLRRMDIKGKILSAVDGDGSLRKSVEDTQMDFSPPKPVVPVHDTVSDVPLDGGLQDVVVAELGQHSIAAPVPEAPAFVPPAFVPPGPVPVTVAVEPPAPPAFVPPPLVPPSDIAVAQTQHA